MAEERYEVETVVNDRKIDELEYLCQELAEYAKHPIMKKVFELGQRIIDLKEEIKSEGPINQVSINGDVRAWHTTVTTCLMKDLVRLGYIQEYTMRRLIYGVDNSEYVSVSSWPADLKEKILNDPKVTKKRTVRVAVSTSNDYDAAMRIVDEAKKAKEEFE